MRYIFEAPKAHPLVHCQDRSQTVASLFDECDAKITEALLSISLPEQIRILIRVVTIVRSGSIPSHSLSDAYLSCGRRCVMFTALECLRRTNSISDERPKSCSKCGIGPPLFKRAASTSHSVLQSILDGGKLCGQTLPRNASPCSED